MRALVVAIHDVTPETAGAARRWRDLAARVGGGPVSILVVPRYGGVQTWLPGPDLEWLHWRAQAGDEIVLHGTTHQTAAGHDGPEFRRLGWMAAANRLEEGRAELARVGLRAMGTIFPCYGSPQRPDEACDAAGLVWWASRSALTADGRRRHLASLGVGASSRIRRAVSPAALRLAVRAVRTVPAVRLDIHPADLLHDRLASAGLDALRRLVADGREMVTHEALLPLTRVPEQVVPVLFPRRELADAA